MKNIKHIVILALAVAAMVSPCMGQGKLKFAPRVDINLDAEKEIQIYILDMRAHVWLPSEHFLWAFYRSQKREYVGNFHNITWTTAPGKRYPFLVGEPLDQYLGSLTLKAFSKNKLKPDVFSALPQVGDLDKEKNYSPSELDSLFQAELQSNGPWTPTILSPVGDSEESWIAKQSSDERIAFLKEFSESLSGKSATKVLLLIDVFQSFGPLKKEGEKIGKAKDWVYNCRYSIETLVWGENSNLLSHRRIEGQPSYVKTENDFKYSVIEEIFSEEGIQGSLRGSKDPIPYSPLTISERDVVFQNLIDYYVMDKAAFTEF